MTHILDLFLPPMNSSGREMFARPGSLIDPLIHGFRQALAFQSKVVAYAALRHGVVLLGMDGMEDSRLDIVDMVRTLEVDSPRLAGIGQFLIWLQFPDLDAVPPEPEQAEAAGSEEACEENRPDVEDDEAGEQAKGDEDGIEMSLEEFLGLPEGSTEGMLPEEVQNLILQACSQEDDEAPDDPELRLARLPVDEFGEACWVRAVFLIARSDAGEIKDHEKTLVKMGFQMGSPYEDAQESLGEAGFNHACTIDLDSQQHQGYLLYHPEGVSLKTFLETVNRM